MVVPGVVPADLCERVIADIQFHGEIDPEDAATWYQGNFAGHGFVPVHHTQAMWDVRQHPAVHAVFAALYGQAALWVTSDRLSYKPPASAESAGWKQAPVHWDCDPWQFSGRSIQGVVYLTDTSEEQGAFACVPSIYASLPAYLSDHADDADRRQVCFAPDALKPIPGPAGSLVLFSRLMPHTGLRNASMSHRYVQYVAMNPVGNETLRASRVREFRDRMPPEWAIKQAVPGQQIPEPGPAISLTALGRKLVGIDLWPDEHGGSS